jgi:Tfp pilus assembly protein PilX
MTVATLGRQRGVTLLVSLVMLVILTLFAIAGFNLSSVNLKVAGNFQAQKAMDAVAQQALEQVITTTTAFSLTPTSQTVCVNGTGGGCTGGYQVAVDAPRCNYAVTAKGYTKKIGELTPEDTDWEVRAVVTDSVTSARSAIVQGVRIRMLSGNCPA